jgi:hypothetical protein
MLPLSGCTDKKMDEAASVKKSDESSSVKQKTSIASQPAFTLSCEGKYNLTTSGGETKDGLHGFKITIEPSTGRVYMFDWIASGWFHNPMAEMNNKIGKINTISDEEITTSEGSIVFDRFTGRYSGAASVGNCEKIPDTTPIPAVKKF